MCGLHSSSALKYALMNWARGVAMMEVSRSRRSCSLKACTFGANYLYSGSILKLCRALILHNGIAEWWDAYRLNRYR